MLKDKKGSEMFGGIGREEAGRMSEEVGRICEGGKKEVRRR